MGDLIEQSRGVGRFSFNNRGFAGESPIDFHFRVKRESDGYGLLSNNNLCDEETYPRFLDISPHWI